MSARILTFLILLLAAVWGVWPYGSLWFFGRAVDQDNEARLGAMVDWPSVRDHLKGDVKRRLSAELGHDKDEEDAGKDVARGALLLLGSVVAEGLIDAYATPEGLMAVLREISHADRGEGEFLDTVSYAFFAAPTRFRVHVKPAGSGRNDGKPLVLIYSFQDFSWTLTRIKLPLDELENGPPADDPAERDDRQ